MTAERRVDLDAQQRAAMERNLGGGLAGYIQRIRRDHGPRFNGDTYTGCRCGEVGCGKPLLLEHMNDLIRAYEAKVQDFAAETRRSSALLAEVKDAREALARAWEEGAHAGGTYQREIQRHAHWSHIGKALPTPIANPYRAALTRGGEQP
jgi:hypothetical protein